MPLVLGGILWVLVVTAAVGIAAYVVDRGKSSLAVIFWVLVVTAVVGIAAYVVDRSTARQERKD